TDLGVMNGPNSATRRLSDTGVVVGWTGTTSLSNDTRAFVHSPNQTMIFGPVPGGFTSWGVAANSAGQVIITGQIGRPNDYVTRSFRYQQENWTQLHPLPGDQYSVVTGITNDGLVVGASRIPSVSSRACAWFD